MLQKQADFATLAAVAKQLFASGNPLFAVQEAAAALQLPPLALEQLLFNWAGLSPQRLLQLVQPTEIQATLAKGIDLAASVSAQNLLPVQQVANRVRVHVQEISPATPQPFAGASFSYGFHNTPFGEALLLVSEQGLGSLTFCEKGAQNQALVALRKQFKGGLLNEQPEHSQPFIQNIFYPSTTDFEPIPIQLVGSAFQLKVWQELLQVPFGRLTTYQSIATKLGNPLYNRAVGTAVGQNQLAFIVPCHRVVRKSGVIGDYRWGKLLKQLLIAWEISLASK